VIRPPTVAGKNAAEMLANSSVSSLDNGSWQWIDLGAVECRRRTASNLFGVKVVDWPFTPASDSHDDVAVRVLLELGEFLEGRQL